MTTPRTTTADVPGLRSSILLTTPETFDPSAQSVGFPALSPLTVPAVACVYARSVSIIIGATQERFRCIHRGVVPAGVWFASLVGVST